MKKALHTLLLVLVLGSTFALINFDILSTGPSVTIFRDPDEAWYGITMKRLLTDDCTGVPVSFEFSDRANFHSCKFLKGIAQLSPGSTISEKVFWMKLLTRALILAILAIAGIILFQSSRLGYLIGLVYFVDDGIPYLKPLFGPIKSLLIGENLYFSRANRIISPMQYSLVGLAFTLLFIAEIQGRLNNKKRWSVLIFFVPVVLVLPLTPIYSWINYFYFLGAILLFVTITRPTKNLVFAWVLLVAEILACLFESFGKLNSPNIGETLVRSGFFSEQFTPLFLFDKALLLSLGLFIFIYWKQLKWWAPFFAFGLYALVNVNIFTGREYQNFHFREYFGFLVFMVLLWGTWTRWEKSRKFLVGVLITSFIFGSAEYVRSQTQLPSRLSEDLSLQDREQIQNFFADKKSNVLCGPFYQILPLTTDTVCSWHHLLMTYPLSNLELMQFTQANFKLQRLSNDEVLKIISFDATPTRALGVWSYGVKNEWISGLSQIDTYSVETLTNKIIPLWMNEYDSMTDEQSKAFLKNSQYLILKNSAAETLQVKPVEKFSTYGIYQWAE